MGNHWGAGRDKEPAGTCAAAVRVLAAGAVIAVSFLAFGFPGMSGQPGTTAAPAGSVSLPGLAGGFLTDSRALVPFSRTIITTVAKDGHVQLNVASAGLKRPAEGSLMAPLEVLRPSSPFGYRISPISGTAGDFHLGQDYAASCGTRVYSADAGVVRAAGWHPWGGGNRVEIDHGNGLITTYNHLQAIAVRAGDTIQVGQVIARVGTTGWSTGCHLHFETILHGKHTSPLDWTLLPVRQLDELEDIAMVSYDGKAADVSATQRWAIPVATDNSHAVLNGEHELSEAPVGSTAGPTPESTATATQTPTVAPSPTGSATEPSTATTTATAAPSESTSPTSSPPSETASASPTPTPTDTPPAPVPTGTSPTPTESATPAPTLTSAPVTQEPPATESSTATSMATEPSSTATDSTATDSTVTEPAPQGP